MKEWKINKTQKSVLKCGLLGNRVFEDYKNVLKERNFEKQNRSLCLRLESDDGDNKYLEVQAVLHYLEKKFIVDRHFHIQYRTAF